MHIQQAVIDEGFARELFSVVPEILKGLPLSERLFEAAPDLETRINTSCLSWVKRLETRRELFKSGEHIQSDVDAAAQSAMMALDSLPELHSLFAANFSLYGQVSTILKGRFMECAVKRLC